MNDRQRILAVLNNQSYDRLPIVHFGFLEATLKRWASEGHFSLKELSAIGDATPDEDILTRKLGFDCNYHRVFGPSARIEPPFESKVIEVMPNGYRKLLTGNGAIVLDGIDTDGIPAEFDHILKSRKEWEEIFLPRLHYTSDRVNQVWVNCNGEMRRFDQGGREYLLDPNRETHILLHCGSLYGALRDYVGIVNLSYLAADDEALFDEMIDVNAHLCYRCAEEALATGVSFDIGHFWEDIAFKNGPLVSPKVFARKIGPHYKRITDLLHKHSINLVSLDCDGMIDLLVPIWLNNGVNVMFPVEVGTWRASIEPWRSRYGPQLLGVGGMDKRVFKYDYAKVDAEVERLKRLVDLGGYLPCPDHRIAQDARWENVQYYCDKMRQAFGG